eukprot:3125820-Heterocapsa_arctica.AAC.1
MNTSLFGTGADKFAEGALICDSKLMYEPHAIDTYSVRAKPSCCAKRRVHIVGIDVGQEEHLQVAVSVLVHAHVPKSCAHPVVRRVEHVGCGAE